MPRGITARQLCCTAGVTWSLALESVSLTSHPGYTAVSPSGRVVLLLGRVVLLLGMVVVLLLGSVQVYSDHPYDRCQT